MYNKQILKLAKSFEEKYLLASASDYEPTEDEIDFEMRQEERYNMDHGVLAPAFEETQEEYDARRARARQYAIQQHEKRKYGPKYKSESDWSDKSISSRLKEEAKELRNKVFGVRPKKEKSFWDKINHT